MKLIYLILCITFSISYGYSQSSTLHSPNGRIRVELLNKQSADTAYWYLKVHYTNNEHVSEVFPEIRLGLVRSDNDFSQHLQLIKQSKNLYIKENYQALLGKRSQRSNEANEVTFYFKQQDKLSMNVIVRVYNDGVTFRYEFSDTRGTFTIQDEVTSYLIPDGTKRWLEKFNPANEGYYREMSNGETRQDWAYPALFQHKDSTVFYLIHEADLGRTYCGTKLSNTGSPDRYKLVFPDDWNGRGQGKPQPDITLPWKSPWRVIIIGTLADIVSSTLVEDVSTPTAIKNTEWIKPGPVSWNYWSHNHGTKDFKTVCEFADLAAKMGWPYTLLDWEWDAMGNGGNLEDAIKYIHSIGVTPLIWYNSGGNHTWVQSTPKDRMLTHENRVEEFAKLKKMGIAGVKVDFFESEKQDMINYYLDILEDAAEYEMMVYFHGCIVPRGWTRTYPHLMTYEAVRGAEWYNNGPDFTLEAPVHNTILPFTRNVVGSMDYTPVTFTNSQFPHQTSYGHELALSILFESGLQHLADRPDGYDRLPDEVKMFLSDIPTAWDDTQLLDGYPGKDIILARRKDTQWYIGGINAEPRGKHKNISFDFLAPGKNYKLTLITDGEHDTSLSVTYMVVNNSSKVDVSMLRRGGFAGVLQPLE